ncbi:MAG: SipW-dependent-type signal peptide-containing protein [Clostridia bacterium]|nr:SipW-dependent-type signal peptide-containing protein [Clostridia bacterium]
MKKSTTRRALLTSAFAFILCISMFIGTTFAWFTDTATSANNIIQSGNLDVEVYYGNPADKNSITNVNTLFNDVELWEPGAVAWENLTVVNEGSLALKFKFTINFMDENYIVGTNAKLSQVLKIAIVEGGVSQTDRATVLEEAGEGALLKNFIAGGSLIAGESITYGVVIWWEPSANDNNWNVINGKQTSDGLPLHINLGVNVSATQMDYEEDAFGPEYDAGLGEVLVSSYAELVEALKAGGDIGLCNDIEIDVTSNDEIAVIPEEIIASLDLNGFSLYTPEGVTNVYALNNRGTLTLLDSVGGGSIDALGIANDFGSTDNISASLTIDGANINGEIYNEGNVTFGATNIARATLTGNGSFYFGSEDNTIFDGVTISCGEYYLDDGRTYTFINTSITGGTFYMGGGSSFQGKDVGTAPELSIEGGDFIDVNPAVLNPALAEDNSEYIAINYTKSAEPVRTLTADAEVIYNSTTRYIIAERENTVILEAPDSVYEQINTNYTVKTVAAGKLYAEFSALSGNDFSTVYILPGTYNEATTLTVTSSMDIIGLGDKEDIKLIKQSVNVKKSNKNSNRHLFNVNGNTSEYIHVTLRNLYLDASAVNIITDQTIGNKVDNGALQAIRKAKVKCYDLMIAKGNSGGYYAFYGNGTNKVTGESVNSASYLYLENCSVDSNVKNNLIETMPGGESRIFYNNCYYNNGQSLYDNTNIYIKNQAMAADDWDWVN